DLRLVELRVGGMTCAACAARVEKKLNRLAGVTATVNFATGTAHVRAPAGVSVDDLVRTVEATGYTATLPPPEEAEEGDEPPAERVLRTRLVVNALLTAPLLVLTMVPATQFRYWQWVALALATPVVTWGAWPFHRAALVNARHATATMDTLISLGVVVAYGWSVVALLVGGAGEPGMRMRFTLLAEPGAATGHLYLEVGAALTTFLTVGRWFEARAKRRAGSAVRALLNLGARDATLLRDGVEVRVPAAALRVGDLFEVRPGEKVATDGVVGEGTSAVDASMLTGWRLGCCRAGGCGWRCGPAARSWAARPTAVAGWWSRPRGSGPTPSSPRWRGWSPSGSPARRRSSGWPTASPGSSYPR